MCWERCFFFFFSFLPFFFPLLFSSFSFFHPFSSPNKYLLWNISRPSCHNNQSLHNPSSCTFISCYSLFIPFFLLFSSHKTIHISYLPNICISFERNIIRSHSKYYPPLKEYQKEKKEEDEKKKENKVIERRTRRRMERKWKKMRKEGTKEEYHHIWNSSLLYLSFSSSFFPKHK